MGVIVNWVVKRVVGNGSLEVPEGTEKWEFDRETDKFPAVVCLSRKAEFGTAPARLGYTSASSHRTGARA